MKTTTNKMYPAVVLFLLTIFFSSMANAALGSLEGLWFESDNYPASSVLRFDKYGKGWIGRYVKVSAQQREYGFSIGEAVIRGTFKGNEFHGQVLLKTTASRIQCPDLTIGWVPIKMTLDSTGRLQGSWLQTVADAENSCAVLGQYWQPYNLDRLPSKN